MSLDFIPSFLVGALVGAAVAGSLIYLRIKNALIEKSAELSILKQQKLDAERLESQLGQRFQALANQILDEKSSKISDQNMKNLSLVLDPLKERLKDFEKKVEETYSVERSERGTLRGELNKIIELNTKMSSDAQHLVSALKGDSKTQGNWGEMILENILERSGLRKGEEFIIQGSDLSLKNDEGQIIRPDVIIKLPDNKHIIVDAKVSLKDYDAYAASENPEIQERFAKSHVDSLKRHIDGLSAKKYYSADQLLSPDFVILFMPIEPAFALAFKIKPDLLQYAWERNIALVSPTTLLTTLRTVAAIWKQERQEKNAQEIAKRGGALYDKFVMFIQDLEGLGKKLDDAHKAHHSVMSKLSEGPGNLVRQIEMLKELGAKSEKKISDQYLLK